MYTSAPEPPTVPLKKEFPQCKYKIITPDIHIGKRKAILRGINLQSKLGEREREQNQNHTHAEVVPESTTKCKIAFLQSIQQKIS